MGGTDLAVFVDFQIARTQEPVGFTDLASRVIDVEGAVFLPPLDFNTIRIAAPACCLDLYFEGRFIDGAVAAFKPHAHFSAFEHVSALLDAHVAARLHFICGLVVTQPVGVNRLSAAAQAHRAFGLEFTVLMTLHLIGFDEQG